MPYPPAFVCTRGLSTEMNWNAVGAVGEVVGAIAVVLTLIYLAHQVRLGRLATEAASVDALAAGWNTLNVHLLSDPALMRVYVEGFADPEALSELEQAQLVIMAQSYINHFQAVNKRYDAGLLPGNEFEVQAAGISQNSPGGRWVLERCGITPDLLAVTDRHRGAPRPDGFVGIRDGAPRT